MHTYIRNLHLLYIWCKFLLSTLQLRSQRKVPRRKCTQGMKEILRNGEWLTDDHISLSQELLRSQFPHIDGLQSPLLAENGGFSPVHNEAIQIHHIIGNHWVMSSNIGQEVTVYGSMFTGGDLSSSLTHLLALMYRPLITKEDGEEVDAHLVVHIPPVQQQNGLADCGVFAIAFALHTALGHKVPDLEFDQSKMRSHLLKCLTDRRLLPFPTLEKCGFRPKHFPYREIEVYCICLMPETYDDMVECEECEQWFHLDCVGLSTLPKDTEHCCSLCRV